MKKAIALMMILLLLTVTLTVLADGKVYILRRESDKVLVQKTPGAQPYEYWRLWDNNPPCGAQLTLTGKVSGQWVEVVCDYLPTSPTGWIKTGYLVSEPVTECHQLATVKHYVMARGYIGGAGTAEFFAGEVVEVYYRTDSYCSTRWGFVPTDALDFDCTATKATAKHSLAWNKLDHRKRDHLAYDVDPWW